MGKKKCNCTPEEWSRELERLKANRERYNARLSKDERKEIDRKRYEKRKAKDPIQEREKWRLRKERERKNNRDVVNDYQRKYYEINREQALTKILECRKRRNPTIGLTRLLREFQAGKLGLDEFTKRFNEAIERSYELTCKKETRK